MFQHSSQGNTGVDKYLVKYNGTGAVVSKEEGVLCSNDRKLRLAKDWHLNFRTLKVTAGCDEFCIDGSYCCCGSYCYCGKNFSYYPGAGGRCSVRECFSGGDGCLCGGGRRLFGGGGGGGGGRFCGSASGGCCFGSCCCGSCGGAGVGYCGGG
jgi:hypothetical protein